MSDSPIRALPGNAEPQPRVIHLLEDLLQKARDGQLQDVAVVGITPNRRVVTGLSAHDNLFNLAGGLAYLQQKVVNLVE